MNDELVRAYSNLKNVEDFKTIINYFIYDDSIRLLHECDSVEKIEEKKCEILAKNIFKDYIISLELLLEDLGEKYE